jgi:CheY-like chemotaxis protein
LRFLYLLPVAAVAAVTIPDGRSDVRISSDWAACQIGVKIPDYSRRLHQVDGTLCRIAEAASRMRPAAPKPKRTHPQVSTMKEFGTAQANLLLIDDEADVLDGLTKILAAAGYHCRRARNEGEALEAIRQSVPDLIVSDINLGGQSGLSLIEQIRREENMSDVPVMFLSGAQIPDIIRRAHAAGGTYYLRKPFDPQVLMELIEKALWMPHLINTRAARV